MAYTDETETLETIALPVESTSGDAIPEVTFPDYLETGTADGQAHEEIDFEMVAMQLAQTMRRLITGGDQIVAILCEERWLAPVEAAFRGLAEGVLPAALLAETPFVTEEGAQAVQIITRSDLEIQFLTQFYGPRETGGNGFLARLQGHLDRNNCPLRVTPEFLRIKFLLETAERLEKTGITTPNDLYVAGMPSRR